MTRSAPSRAAVDDAIARSRAYLQGVQRADGSWPAPGEVGPAATAQTAACLAFCDELSSEDGRRIASWLEGQASASGGFVLFPRKSEGHVGATAVVAAYLRRYGGSASVIDRAERFVRERGGVERITRDATRGDLSLLYLAMLGELAPSALPDMPLYALATGAGERWFLRRFHGGVLMTAFAQRLVTKRLRASAGLSTGPSWLSRRETERGVHWLTTFQNPMGSWNAWAPVTALHLAALHAAGVGHGDPRIQRALGWLSRERREDDTGLFWDAFEVPLWATIFTVHALVASGSDARDPALVRAREYLLAAQCRSPQARENHQHGDGPLVGGYAFRADNTVLPDCDDAGAALGALSELARDEDHASIDALVAWLRGMQNPDGGWASYVCGHPTKPRGPLFTSPVVIDPSDPRTLLALAARPPLELGDPSAEDVTGRVLSGLGARGFRVGDPSVDRGLAFLRAQQLDDGSFFGRWLTNYTAGTSYAVRGALAVGAKDLWIERGLDFLGRCQRDDGAFGESVDSYERPETKGKGPACAAVTGRVLTALIDGGRAKSSAVSRAVRWLVDAQREGGDWDGSQHLCAIYPPETFYRHAPAGTYYPLWALASWRAAT